MVELVAHHLLAETADATIVDVDHLVLGRGLTALIGPNGAGKSSLMRILAGFDRPLGASVRVDGQCLTKLDGLARARLIGWLPQSLPMAWPLHVRDVVAMGRFSYGRGDAGGGHKIDDAMVECGIAHLTHRTMPTLSGGEERRVHLARVLVGNAPLLLLDEPVAALDPAQMLHILARLRARADAGANICIILHDVLLAARFANRIIGMKQGRILFDQPTDAAIDAKNLGLLYDTPAQILTVDGHKIPYFDQ